MIAGLNDREYVKYMYMTCQVVLMSALANATLSVTGREVVLLYSMASVI